MKHTKHLSSLVGASLSAGLLGLLAVGSPPAFSDQSVARSLLGSWACYSRGNLAAAKSPEYDTYQNDGFMRWQFSSYRQTNNYKFDGRILTLYGPHLPGVLKWELSFESPDSYTIVPIQGEIVGAKCTRARFVPSPLPTATTMQRSQPPIPPTARMLPSGSTGLPMPSPT